MAKQQHWIGEGKVKIGQFRAWWERVVPFRVDVPWIDQLILCSMALVTITGMVIWLSQHGLPPHWDQANHLVNSLRYTDMVDAAFHADSVRGFVREWYYFFIKANFYYPPFAYWLTVPFVLLFGRGEVVPIMVNSIYAFVLVWSAYSVGRNLWNRTTGLLLAAVLLFSPFATAQFHEFQLDLPLLTVTTLVFALLLKSNFGMQRTWSFWLGAALGVGMLTKWTIAAFLVVPMGVWAIACVVRAWQGSKEGRRERFVQLLWGVGWFALGLGITAGPWYITHLAVIRAGGAHNATVGLLEGDPLVGTVLSWRYYYDALLSHHLRLPLVILSTIGLVWSLVNKKALLRNGLFILYIIGAYLLLTQYQNKDFRYIQPIIIGFSLLSVFWISLLPRILKYIGAGVVVALCIFQFLTINWGSVLFPKMAAEYSVSIPDPLSGSTSVTVYRLSGYIIGSPARQDWYQETIVSKLFPEGTQAATDVAPRIAMYYVDAPRFNKENLGYAFMQQRLRVGILPFPPVADLCTSAEYLLTTSDVPQHAALNLTCETEQVLQETLPNGVEIRLSRILP
jgi:hypothetical protein